MKDIRMTKVVIGPSEVVALDPERRNVAQAAVVDPVPHEKKMRAMDSFEHRIKIMGRTTHELDHVRIVPNHEARGQNPRVKPKNDPRAASLGRRETRMEAILHHEQANPRHDQQRHMMTIFNTRESRHCVCAGNSKLLWWPLFPWHIQPTLSTFSLLAKR
jgi:hypothetical protein